MDIIINIILLVIMEFPRVTPYYDVIIVAVV
jgi:hypothetical protein